MKKKNINGLLNIVIILIAIFSSTVFSQGAWPGEGANASISWINYTLSDGSIISDADDQSPNSVDIFYCAQDASSVKVACDGTHMFFRMQLQDDPAGNPGGYSNNGSFLVQIADVSGTFKVSVGLDAKLSDDLVYVISPAGTTQYTVYLNSSTGTTAMRSLVVPGQTTNYYLDWQAPISEIARIWTGFTSTTPMRLFYGTAATGNANINKDYMTGSVVDFSIVAQAKPVSISTGQLYTALISGNTTTSGVTLSYTDGSAKTATSDGSGNYSFYVSNNWSGTVTPSKTGYTFSPTNRSYVSLTTDQTNQDYSIATILISGNAGVAGATLSYTDGTAKTATADESGNYSFYVSYNWTGTVTPSKTGYTFSPENRSYSNITSPQTGQDYTATLLPVISGNTMATGVTLSYTDGAAKTVTSDGSGDYAIYIPSDWSGTVTPSKDGYTFSPANRIYSNVVADQTNQNYSIATIRISGNAGVSGATLSYTDVTAKTATADGDGNYSFYVSYNWSGTVVPSKDGEPFTPENRTYTNLTSPQSGQNYASALPVELISFEAEVLDNNIWLSWQTATEVNNYGFEIERKSFDADASSLGHYGWEAIGFVEGSGNSNSTKEYSFNDKSVQTGKYLYRLKQIDNDGSFTYSYEITVETRSGEFLPKEFELFQNYPNPFNPTTIIKYALPKPAKVSLKVYDLLGNEVAELVNKEQEAGNHSIVFDVNLNSKTFASGIYFYRIKTDDLSLTKKMLIIK